MFIIFSKSFLIFDKNDIVDQQTNEQQEHQQHKSLILYDLKHDSNTTKQIDWFPANHNNDQQSKHPIKFNFNTGTVSDLNNYIAITDDIKNVLIFDNNFKKINEFKLRKNAQKMLFTKNEEKLLICDKAGDIYEYNVQPNISDNKQNDENNNGKLLLGHCSMLLDFILTNDEQYIISADRDEKIRVSHYPNSYNIETYCLGHTQFVSTINIINHEQNLLISGSGDGQIKCWNYLNGKLLFTYDFNEQQPIIDKNDGNLENGKMIKISSKRSIFAIKSITIDNQNNKSRFLCVSFLNKTILYLFEIEYHIDNDQQQRQQQFKSLNIVTQLNLNRIPIMVQFDLNHINFLWLFGGGGDGDGGDVENNDQPIKLYELKDNKLNQAMTQMNIVETLNNNEKFRQKIREFDPEKLEYLFKNPYHQRPDDIDDENGCKKLCK